MAYGVASILASRKAGGGAARPVSYLGTFPLQYFGLSQSPSGVRPRGVVVIVRIAPCASFRVQIACWVAYLPDRVTEALASAERMRF